jgi:hypothetical protein
MPGRCGICSTTPCMPRKCPKVSEPLLSPKQAAEQLLVSEKAVLDWLRLRKEGRERWELARQPDRR